ncbi:MAG: tetratricopeptide repeat protein [Gammaproteobacteria bacterium]|nr:tetratricopeptide repeat protein [Gammaproteobacteria bacterium]
MKSKITIVLVAAIAPLLLGNLSGGGTSSSSSAKHEKYFQKGVIAHEAKDYDTALELYRKALKIKPDYADALNNLGFTLRTIGKQYFDEADEAYAKVLTLDSNHHEALEYQGELYLWQGKISKANENYQRLLDLGSDEAAELKKKIDEVLSDARKVL